MTCTYPDCMRLYGGCGLGCVPKQKDQAMPREPTFVGPKCEPTGSQYRAQIHELRAEVERLKEGWKTAFNIGVSEQEQNKILRAEIERLRAENARLKEIEIKYDQLISGAFI